MSVDLNDLSPNALKAAMRGGAAAWGQWGSSSEHIRYMEPLESKYRRRCHCGCKRRATHRGATNGVTLNMGCELAMRRWVRESESPAGGK